MSGANEAIRAGLTRPREASYGDRLERAVAVTFVGGLTGLASAMAMYAFRLQAITYPWASETLLAVLVFVAGLLAKLLIGEMRASVTALMLSIAVGAAAMFAFELSPYYILDIGTAGGYALYVPLRDVITFVLMFQMPLQFSGYLTAVVYDGMRA